MGGVAAVDFVVRTRGRWILAPVPAAEPRSIGLDELLGLLGPTSAPEPAVDPSDHLAPEERVRPVWSFVGRVEPGALVIEDADGEPLPLDPIDLRLLDAIGGTTSPADLEPKGDPIPMAVRCARLGRLRRARRLEGADG